MIRDRLKRLARPVARPVLRRWRTRRSTPDGRRLPKRRDWIAGPPDFVGVGVQRSGTNWWWRVVCDHPGIHATGAKELHFFDRYFAREFSEDDVREYHRLFRRPSGYMIGEWTPRYMHDFWTPALLREAAPDARILVLLRDPLARYRSGFTYERDALKRAVRRRRRQYVAAMDANDALSRSLYARPMATLLEHFDRSQVLVLQYERCVEDPARELRRTYEFLGLDGIDHVPASLRDRLGQKPPPVQFTDAVTEAARRVFVRDIIELKAMVPEIDVDLWPSCRDIDSARSND
jgi:sulfotransferase family protein